ncbi:MAG: hypothetical protein MJ106_05105 [Lentisphaeria bacterium]|nr:hypothetical protein [Lentisphaeria bacterium]
MSNFICKEAIRWCLRQISYNDFIGLSNVHRGFTQAVFKGGFTMNAKNFRSEAIVKRLVNMFFRRDDILPVMLAFVSNKFRDIEHISVLELSSHTADNSLENFWRDKFASEVDGRPLAMALYHNGTAPRLSRLADLLLHVPSFWQNGKAMPRGKVKAAKNLADECGKQLSNLLNKRIEQRGRDSSVAKLTQPMIPGLLPLMDKNAVAQNTENEAPKSVSGNGAFVEAEGGACAPEEISTSLKGEKPADVLSEERKDVAQEKEAEPVVGKEQPLAEGEGDSCEVIPCAVNDGNGMQEESTRMPSNASVENTLVPIAEPLSESKDDADGILKLSAKDDELVSRLRDELAQARKRNGEMSRDNDQLRRKLRIQTELGEKEKTAHRRELDAARSQLDAVRNELEDAIDEIREDYESLHEQQMAAYYAEGLCVHPDQVAYLCETQKETQNLRSRVEAALSRQKKVDKNYGSVSELRHEEQQLEQMLSRVHLAIEESLTLCPELRGVERELTDKLAEVRSKLRRDSGDFDGGLFGILPRMELYIKELPAKESTLREFDELEKFLDGTSRGRGLFAAEEIKGIKERIAMRRQYITRAMEASAGIENVPDEKIPFLGERMEHIMKMSWYVDRLKEVELYIDAYNVIKRDPIMSVKEKASNGFGTVRNEFNEHCRRISRLFKKVTVVYDGNLPTENVEKKGDSFYVVYAAKREDGQNADNWIVNKLSELSGVEADDTVKRWVVTDDGGLLARVANFCDGYVDDATFVGFTQVRI